MGKCPLLTKDFKVVETYGMPKEKVEIAVYGEKKIKPPWEKT